MSNDFIKWVKSEMRQRGLAQKDVAGTTVTRPQVSMVLSGKSEPGEKFYLAVARAFRLPLDEIYARAGIATSAPRTEKTDMIARKLADLPPDSQEQAEEFIDFLRAKKKKDNEDPTDDDLIDQASKLTTGQRRRVIETGDTLRVIRQKKKNQPETPPENLHPPKAVQSQLL